MNLLALLIPMHFSITSSWLGDLFDTIGNLIAGDDEMALIDGATDFQTDPASALNRIIGISIGLGVAIAIILVAAGGYRMMSSGGDAAKLKDAREQIQNAILGLLLILGSITVLSIVFNIFGISGVL